MDQLLSNNRAESLNNSPTARLEGREGRPSMAMDQNWAEGDQSVPWISSLLEPVAQNEFVPITIPDDSVVDETSVNVAASSSELPTIPQESPSESEFIPLSVFHSTQFQQTAPDSDVQVNPEMAYNALQGDIMDWQPARLLHIDSFYGGNQFALLILNQPIENALMLCWVWEKAFFRIAADGAANRLKDASRAPRVAEMFNRVGLEVICGDLDSIEPTIRESAQRRGTRIVQVQDQDSTDFEKCTSYLRLRVFPVPGVASNIVCLGGLGGRVDHGLSQLHQLYKEQMKSSYRNGLIFLLSSEAITFVLLSGKHRIRVKDKNVSDVLGTHIGIIPLKGPSIITTKGLEWDVTDWLTEFGGQVSTSNLVREDIVEITTSADVLFTIEVDFAKGQREYIKYYTEDPTAQETLRQFSMSSNNPFNVDLTGFFAEREAQLRRQRAEMQDQF